MELKVFLLLFLGIGFCFAKPFPGSETAEDNNESSPNSKLKIFLKDKGRHLQLGSESDKERDEHPFRTEHPLQTVDISKSEGHLDPISSFVKHIIVKDRFQHGDFPSNPIPDFIVQQKVNPIAFPDLVNSFIKGGFQLASDITDTIQGGNNPANILKLSDLHKDNIAESLNESITKFPQPKEANATVIKPEILIQRSIDGVGNLVAFDDGEIIPSAKLGVVITPPDDFKIGEHFESNDTITEKSQAIEEHHLTAIITPQVEEEHLSGSRHVRNAEKISLNIPSIGLRSVLLDNVNVADFIQSESSDKKPQLPKQQSEFDKSDWGSSETADDDEDEKNLKLEERFGEELAFNHSDPHAPSDLDYFDENDTIVFRIASSVLKSFLLAKEKPNIEIIVGGKEKVSDSCSYGNNSRVIEKFDSGKGVYPFGYPNIGAASHIFKSNPITYYDNEEYGFKYPTKVDENDSEGKRLNISLFSLINGRPSIDYSTSNSKSLDIKDGSLFRSLTDESSPLIKSPVNFSELQQREDVVHSNDKFEEILIKSAFKTFIDGLTRQLNPQSVHYPGLLLLKTLTEGENDAKSTQQQTLARSITDDTSKENINDNQTRVARSPSKELVFPLFEHVLKDDSLLEKNTITNSSTLKQEQDKENGSGHESKPKSSLKIVVGEGFHLSDAVKTSIKERFRMSPGKELVSPFFDQVLEDGSLPEEHHNNTNTNSSLLKHEREHGEQNVHDENKPKTLLRTIIDKSFQISNAVKSSINDKFEHSKESLTVPDETIFENIGGNPPRVVRFPGKELVSPFFDQVLEDGSLPDERRNTTDINSSTLNQEQEREKQNDDKQSVPKSLFKIIVDENFRISDAVKTSLKDIFGRPPRKELTSSFFDQVLEDGSLPEEHKNNTNSNSSIVHHENKSHKEVKPESLVKGVVDKTFSVSEAVKTSINERFGRSTGKSTVREEEKSSSDNHEKQTRVARSPSKEQVSPFFDEVLEDGSLPAEHNNSNPTKPEQGKPNVSAQKENKPISLFKIFIDDSLRISDTVKASIKDRFGRAIINSTEQYAFDDGTDKYNAEVKDHENRDIICEGHKRKRRSVKDINQEEIENLKEIRDINKEIIKSVQESAVEEKKPEHPTVAFMDNEGLKEMMPWAVKSDYPYKISFSEDTPFHKKAESLNKYIPADFYEHFSEKSDSAKDADQKEKKNISNAGSNSQFLADILLESNTVNKTTEVHKEIESEYGSYETYEYFYSDEEPEISGGDQKEPGTKVNEDGEELDDEGHVYPNWNWADQKSRMPDPNAP